MKKYLNLTTTLWSSLVSSKYRFEFILLLMTLLLIVHALTFNLSSFLSLQFTTKISDSLSTMNFPFVIVWQITLYIVILLFIHLLIFSTAWLVARHFHRALSISIDNAHTLGLFYFICCWGWILVTNSIDFPRSTMALVSEKSWLYDYLIVAQIFFAFIVIIISSFTALSILFRLTRKKYFALGTSLSFLLSAIILLSFSVNTVFENHDFDRMSRDKPNIIIIGIDSLSFDYLYEKDNKNKMPFLRHYLKDAAVFSNTYTPLARTYTSWMSILSGKYPINTGARANLINEEETDNRNLLTHRLNNFGYKTVYAIDEVRFSNIGEKYGFDKVIAPKTGVTDHLMGAIGDHPISNILANYAIGEYLFPYHYVNRAMYVSYKPKSFNDALSRWVKTEQKSPLFLAAHFCLAHYPYTWNIGTSTVSKNKHRIFHNYETSLRVVDNQVRQLFEDLNSNGLLNNAIVVLLSDHGEDLGEDDDKYVQIDFKDGRHITGINFGHGTNIFSQNQYKVLLSFKRFGEKKYAAKTQHQLSSLIDISPTLLDMISKPDSGTMDGISLLNALNKPDSTPKYRDVFLESGFWLPALNSISPDARKLFEQGIGYYDTTDTGLLVIKKSAKNTLIRSKQLGIRNDDIMLGVYPYSHDASRLYLANDRKKIITEITKGNFDNECRDKCKEMIVKLVDFYGKDALSKLYQAIGSKLDTALMSYHPEGAVAKLD